MAGRKEEMHVNKICAESSDQSMEVGNQSDILLV